MYSQKFEDKNPPIYSVHTVFFALCFAIIGGFLFSKETYAVEIPINVQSEYDVAGNVSLEDSLFCFFPEQEGFLSEVGILTSAPNQSGQPNIGAQWTIYASTTPGTSPNWGSVSVAGDNIENNDVAPLLRYRTWLSTNAPFLETDIEYCVSIGFGGTGSTGGRFYGTNDLSSAVRYVTTTVGGFNDFPSPVTPFFYAKINTSVATSTVFFAPETNVTSTCNFQSWKTSYLISDTDLTALNGEGSIFVQYGFSEYNLDYYDFFYPLDESGIGSVLIPRTGGEIEAGNTLYATVYLCEETNPTDTCTVVGTGDTTSFLINDCAYNVVVPGGTVPAVPDPAENEITCEETDGIVEESLCKILVFLFVPSTESVNKMIEVKDLVINKPPLGYFTAYSDTIESLTTATSTTSTIPTSDISLLFGLLSSLAIWTTFQNVLVVIVWAGFVFYIFERFRHFQL